MVLINNLTIDEINAALLHLQRSRSEVVGGEKGNTVNNVTVNSSGNGGGYSVDYSSLIKQITDRLSNVETKTNENESNINQQANVNANQQSLIEEIEETLNNLTQSGITQLYFDEQTRTLTIYTTEGQYNTEIPSEEVTMSLANNVLTFTMGGQTVTVNMPYIPASEKGAAGGVATLDSSGRLPYSQLPESAAQIQSDWTQTDSTKKDFIKNKIPIWISTTAAQDNMSPIDSVTDGNMQPVTSNAVFDNKYLFVDSKALSVAGWYKIAEFGYRQRGDVISIDLWSGFNYQQSCSHKIQINYGYTEMQVLDFAQDGATVFDKIKVCYNSNNTDTKAIYVHYTPNQNNLLWFNINAGTTRITPYNFVTDSLTWQNTVEYNLGTSGLYINGQSYNVLDSVTSGNLQPVTSNAVYDFLMGYGSDIGTWFTSNTGIKNDIDSSFNNASNYTLFYSHSRDGAECGWYGFKHTATKGGICLIMTRNYGVYVGYGSGVPSTWTYKKIMRGLDN